VCSGRAITIFTAIVPDYDDAGDVADENDEELAEDRREIAADGSAGVSRPQPTGILQAF